MFHMRSNCQTVFQSFSTILHPHQQHKRVSVSPHPCQCWFNFVFLIIAIIVGEKWYLTVVLTCISLLLALCWKSLNVYMVSCIFSWRNFYSNPLPILIRLLVVWIIVICILWKQVHLSHIQFFQFFFKNSVVAFYFLDGIFATQKYLILIWFYLSFVTCAIGITYNL